MIEAKFKDVKIGDRLLRKIRYSSIEHDVIVKAVKGAIITVELPPEAKAIEKVSQRLEMIAKIFGSTAEDTVMNVDWTFSMNSGGEIDIDLGWDGINTGSILIKPEDNGK